MVYQKKLVVSIIVGLMLNMLNACSLTDKAIVAEQLVVLVEEPDRIRFSGKGAGAGLMMMSSMGATGIAIGVAIDEGIGKQIADTASANNIQFVDMIKADFLTKLNKLNQYTDINASDVKLNIQRYGFIVKGGSDDPTTSEFIIRYQLGVNAQWQHFHFPNDKNESKLLLTQPLASVKTDKNAIIALIENGLTHFSLVQ